VSKVEWLLRGHNPDRVPAFAKQPKRFAFRALDTETFLLFRKGDSIEGTELPGANVEELILPLWRTPPASGHRHKFASPPEVVRRFVELLSDPDDLVLDPFCGFGTTLKVAAQLGRRAIGYDVDPICVLESKRES
jgi:DNA modification methylase